MKVISIEEVKKILQSKGIQPSHHRIKVLKYLMEHHNHPSVEMIHQDLVKEIPTLSKTTVYNTLNLLVEKGIAKAFTLEDRETRYDAETTPHAHFRCRKCGNIYDIWKAELSLSEEEMRDFVVDNINIYMTGICPRCKENCSA